METKTLEQLAAVPSSRDETPLFQALKRLGFDSYEPQVAEALKACEQMDPPASPRTVLTIALAAVIRVRDSHKCEMRLKMARFPSLKTLEEFDFSVFSDKRIGGRIHELAVGDYLREHFNILIHGPAGLGKTHLSISLGIRATQQAYSTLFIESKQRSCSPSWRRLCMMGHTPQKSVLFKGMTSSSLMTLESRSFQIPCMEGSSTTS